jgi:hypothetical protein
MLFQTSTPSGSWSVNGYGYSEYRSLSHDRELIGGAAARLAGKELTR